MATAIRTIGHEDRLSLVEHLEELRTRLIVGGAVLVVAFGLCLWQNHALLHVMYRPLEQERRGQVERGEGPAGQTGLAQRAAVAATRETEAVVALLAAPSSGLPPAVRARLAAELPRLRGDAAKVPADAQGEKLLTLGVGEPFTTTLTVIFLFALILSLPVILFELYGFVLPALQPSERHALAPLLAAVPALFAAGVLFGYFVVLPAALRFLVNFNSSEFNIQVQAGPYYAFAAKILLAMGLVFQVPVAVLGATRAGIVTPGQLRRARRWAIVACAAVAAFLPGDAITMVLETIPLYLLYEASILVASFTARRDAARDGAQGEEGGPPPDPPSSAGGAARAGGPAPPSPAGPPPAEETATDYDQSKDMDQNRHTDPSVAAIIDHIDTGLTD
jgi:sec-independent protein translocase protein TatC